MLRQVFGLPKQDLCAVLNNMGEGARDILHNDILRSTYMIYV